jgi:apolipoprotein N-acyltransferase
METLTALQSLGLTLPSPAYIFGSILFGLIGLAAFRHGRKSGRKPALWLGVALMVYPYLVSPTWLLYTVGAALCAGLFVARD